MGTWKLSTLVFCAILLPVPALPQSITGTILGTVYDSSGSVVPNAKVVATNVAQGSIRETTSDGLGNYIFNQLPPGPYKVNVTAQGFQSVAVAPFELLVDQRARVDASLQPGAVTEQVNVTAEATLLESDTNALGQVVNTRNIRTLPLNGRRFFDLALLSAGAAPQGTTFSSVVWGRVTGVSLAGTRDINVSFLVDGAETRDERYGGTFQFSSVESIQEFKVQQNFVDAQYGQAVALVSAVTASGTNEFHGALYEFLRNNKLDARNFFDRGAVPPFRLNQFGGSLGGPIYLPGYKGKDKSFFFVNYEGQRRRRQTTTIATVPTVAQRNGDFSTLPGQIYDPMSGDPATGRRQPFPGNIIPPGRIDPISKALLKYWPEPNLPGNAANFITTAAERIDYDQVTTRIDHNFGSKDRIMGRFNLIDQPFFRAMYAPLAGQVSPVRSTGVVLQYTRILSPRAVNEFRFAYSRSAAGYSQEPVSENLAAQIGLKNTSTDPSEFGIPSVSVTGYNGFGSFSPTISNKTDRFQWADDFTYTRSRHNLKAGIDFRRLRYRQRSAQDPRGFMQYQNNFTNPGPGIAGGNALGDFLLGTPGFWQVQLEELGFDGRMIQPGLYFQDDFKVTSKLSLTLGVRWEYNSPWVQPRNNMAVFNFQTQQLEYALKDPFAFRTSTEAGNAVRRSIIDPQYNNWADRVGLVYRLTKSTVIRAGHGWYWNNVNNNQLTQSMSLFYPFVYNPQRTESNSQLTPTFFNSDLYPGRPSGTDLPSGPSFSFFTVQKDFKRPYTSQWNFNIQQSLATNLVMEIGYMGNQSHHMPAFTNYNQARLPDPSIPFQNQPLQSRRPYPNFGTINMFDRMGNASYHGLTAKLEKRFASGYNFLLSYTWSKALDTGTDINSDPIKQPGDAKSYRSLAALDVGHRFVASYSIELPFGRGKRFLTDSNGVVNAILGGWQMNGITVFSQGVPFGVTVAASIPDVDAKFVTANRSCDGQLPRDQRTRLRYFDTSCFAIPAFGTFGNSARNLWHGPGINNFDMSFFKLFPLGSDRRQLQFRFESFNIFNHTQFNNPSSSLPSGTFGTINSAKAARENQLALRFSF
jgi:hypothetical protein